MKFLVLVSAFLSLSLFSAETEMVHHPAPKKPKYLQENLYSSFKNRLPKPPAIGSKEQLADETEVLGLQKNRTSKDCDRAKSEIFVSLENFFGDPSVGIAQADLKKLTPFFEQIRNDGDFFIQKLKLEYPRKRPFLYLSGAEPCVAKEVTDAYPSGHAVLSRLYALVLGHLYPEKKEMLEKRADQISFDRVLSGMHHPTDIAAGKKIGDMLFEELMKTKNFEADLKKALKS